MTIKEIKEMNLSEIEELIKKHCDSNNTRIIETMKRLNRWDTEEAIMMLSTSKWYRDIQLKEMLDGIDKDIHDSCKQIKQNIRNIYGF